MGSSTDPIFAVLEPFAPSWGNTTSQRGSLGDKSRATNAICLPEDPLALKEVPRPLRAEMKAKIVHAKQSRFVPVTPNLWSCTTQKETVFHAIQTEKGAKDKKM